jgi:hypothetical protein
MGDTSRSQTVSTRLQGIAQQARQYPDMIFTTLAHLMDVDFLREAHRRISKKGAPGLDKVTAVEYGENLDENLAYLHERLRSGRYMPPLSYREPRTSDRFRSSSLLHSGHRATSC